MYKSLAVDTMTVIKNPASKYHKGISYCPSRRAVIGEYRYMDDTQPTHDVCITIEVQDHVEIVITYETSDSAEYGNFTITPDLLDEATYFQYSTVDDIPFDLDEIRFIWDKFTKK